MAHEEEHNGVGHVVPVKYLAATGIILLFLTLVTVWAAGVDLGKINVYLALVIASVKATLVVAFFMHLRWDRPFNSIILLTALLMVSILIGFAMTDTLEYKSTVVQEDAPGVVAAIAEGQQ